jgi:purine-binding chemotaxis protein CheW
VTGQLLLLHSAGTWFAIDTAHVREIVTAQSTTRVPGAPGHIRGLLHLRGALIVTVDLGHRVSGTPTTSPDASIVVVHDAERAVGVLVDDVLDVHPSDDIDITPPPAGQGGGGLVSGMGHLTGRVVIVVDVHELVRQTLA